MLIRLKAVAAEEGLPFGERVNTFNSRRAQELAKWAEANGRGDAFHDAVFRAYFVDGKNIADFDILAELTQAVGLLGKEVETVLRDKTYATAVDDDWARCREMGVTAVPTFRFKQRSITGAQPYEELVKLVSN